MSRELTVQLLRQSGLVSAVTTFESLPPTLGPRATRTPGVLFVDLDGLTVTDSVRLGELGACAVPPRVVALGSEREQAFLAFRLRARDFLLRPLQAHELRRALLGLVRGTAPGPDGSGGSAGAARRGSPGESATRHLMLHDRGSITVVCPGDIAYVQADGKHVIVHASDGVVRARAALATLQGRLDPGRFVRIHRSSLVNVQCIREVIPEAHGDCQLVLLDGTRLTVSRRFRQGLAMLLGG